MKRGLFLTMITFVGAIAAPLALTAPTVALAANPVQKKLDLADRVVGTYEGAVTSDSRGSSRNNITVTITKIGRNMIEIKCDYARIPSRRVQLEQVADSIQAVSGSDITFLVELQRDADRIDLYIDGAALLVRRS
ncbi:hypothetical protein FHS96_001700 [Sphingomonas zeicaulis]|uniref:hypothetical protein n=1 Tax=Sphingomonas zeicaulis TaxID=1632740 RepID=UPI003D203A45